MNLAFYRLCQFLLWCFFKAWNRLEIVGVENLPIARRGCILAANHASYLDPPVFGGGIYRPIAFLAKEELFRVPVFGTVITLLGAVPIAGESDFRTMRTIIRRLKEGAAVLIFPEGTRTRTGEIGGDLKAGVAFLAHAAGVPVIPCYVQGADAALRRGTRFVRPRKIRLHVGKPYEVGDTTADKAEHYERATLDVMRRIKDLKDQAL